MRDGFNIVKDDDDSDDGDGDDNDGGDNAKNDDRRQNETAAVAGASVLVPVYARYGGLWTPYHAWDSVLVLAP